MTQLETADPPGLAAFPVTAAMLCVCCEFPGNCLTVNSFLSTWKPDPELHERDMNISAANTIKRCLPVITTILIS
jgi:hypothetical protein